MTTRGHQNWCRHLRETYDLEVLSDGLSEAVLRDVDVLVFCAPQDKFSEVDIQKFHWQRRTGFDFVRSA